MLGLSSFFQFNFFLQVFCNSTKSITNSSDYMFRIFQGISGREKESVWHIVPYHIITPVCQDFSQTKRKEYQVMADKSVAIAVPPRLPWDWTVVNKSGMALSRVLHQQTGILCVIHISTTDSSVNNTMPSNKFLAVILRKNPKKLLFRQMSTTITFSLLFEEKHSENQHTIDAVWRHEVGTHCAHVAMSLLSKVVKVTQPPGTSWLHCVFSCYLTQSPLCSWWL